MNLLNDFSKFFGGNPDLGLDHDFIANTNLPTYTGTAVGGGSAAAVAAAANGVVRFTGAATTAASGYQIQLPNPPVGMVNKTGPTPGIAQIEARLSLSDTLGQFLLGFSVTAAAMICAPGTDGVWLVKTAGTAEVSLVVRRGGVSVTRSLGNLAKAGEFQEWGLQVSSRPVAQQAEVYVYLNGKVVHQADGRQKDLFSNVPDDALLTPSFAFQSGTNVGTQTCDLDYLRARWTRK